MKIKWLGTASLIIETGAARIAVDPYLKKFNPDLPRLDKNEISGADLCLITHPHLDHFADLQDFFDAGLDSAYVVERGLETARENGIDSSRLNIIHARDELNVGDCQIRAYQSRHCKFDFATVRHLLLSKRTWKMFGQGMTLMRQNRAFSIGPDDILAYEIRSGKQSILIFGSCGFDENTEYPKYPDLLVLAFQGREDLEQKMIPLIEKVQPKALMITHFDDAFPPVTHTMNLEKFHQKARKYFAENRIIVPEENKWIDLDEMN